MVYEIFGRIAFSPSSMDVDFSMGIACLKKLGMLVEKIAMYIADFLEQ